MFLEMLLVVAILTAVVTWYSNRRQVAEATGETKQGADSGETAYPLGKKSPLSAKSWFRRGQKPTDEAQPPTDEAQRPTVQAQRPTVQAQRPTDESQRPTDEGQTPTDEAQPPTDEGQRPTDEGQRPTDEAQTPTIDLSVLSAPFQAWVASTDKIDSELQTWVSTLSDEALKSLTKQLAMHCQSLGMELDWLLGKQLHISPSLQESMPELIVAYLTSRHKAAQVQDEAQVFKSYQEFDKKPENHREFARQLYTKLVEDGLVTMSASDLLQEDRQKRQEYMVSTIRQTANSDPVAFNHALKAVMGL
jgi:hypothetical protein